MRIILDSCHPVALVFDDVLVDGLEFINNFLLLICMVFDFSWKSLFISHMMMCGSLAARGLGYSQLSRAVDCYADYVCIHRFVCRWADLY